MGLIALLIAVASAASPTPAGASIRPFVLPISPGETWYVCQGYNGLVSHEALPALDLSLDPDAAGSDGCLAGTKYSSAGSVVSSPAAGTAYQWPGCCGDDFVCVNLDSGGSVAIGHLDDRISSGTRVGTGTQIGSVAWPNAANGDYGHIHAQAHADPDCTDGSAPVAFDVAHGFRWACVPDLPYSGTPNQYSGLAVKRCGAPADPDDQESEVVEQVTRDSSWRILVMVVRSVDTVMDFAGPGVRA